MSRFVQIFSSGLSNSAMITAVNQVIASREVGAALGTIATIWNIIGSIMLAISAAIFHSVETQSSFLPAFHSMLNFNILFAMVILIASVLVFAKLIKSK